MAVQLYISYAVAGVMLLAMLRVLWSTSGRQLAKYRLMIRDGLRTLEQVKLDLERVEEAREMLNSANLALKRTLREKDAEIAAHLNEILALKKNLDTQKAANETLNTTIGNQQLKIAQLSRDLELLNERVFKLSCQLGIEP